MWIILIVANVECKMRSNAFYTVLNSTSGS